MNEPYGFEVWLEEDVEGLEWGTTVFGTVDVPRTCLVVDTEKMYDPQIRMTPSLPDDCDAKEAGRVLYFGMRGRQGGCGSPARRDCAGRRREGENQRGCCFGEGAVGGRELEVVLGLGLSEGWVGYFGRRLTGMKGQ